MIQIVLLISGIIILVRGHLLVTPSKEVRGWPARFICAMLIVHWPLTFVVGMALGGFFLAQGKPVDGKEYQEATRTLALGIAAFCFLAAMGIARLYAEPTRKEQKQEGDEVGEIPRHSGEHFSSEPGSGSASRTDRQDVTDQPLRSPARQDDRIRE